ncbi:MAG: glycine betaine/L-proline ABC transporter substrate-binding protein ProX [Chloroflexota bacterium]
MKKKIIGLILIFMALGSHSQSFAELEQQTNIGGNRPIQMGRATWDTGWFQAEVYRQLLLELGYDVPRARTYDVATFFEAASAGEVDFWVNGWFPLHNGLLTDQLEVLGDQVAGGALQGYMVDKASAEALNITTLEDFTRPEVIERFDANGDGQAEMIGCNSGWVCRQVIDHHLEVYGLSNTVEQVQGDYGPLMLNTRDQYTAGNPVFFYTWTPNWTIGELVPGEEVVWISVPFASLPDGRDTSNIQSSSIEGCATPTCLMGFPPSDIQAVANREFLQANSAVRALLNEVTIPAADIAAQNVLLVQGEDEQQDIERHALEWIEANRPTVDQWLAAAIAAHDESLIVEPTTDTVTETTSSIARLQVATKPLAPFVIYDVGSREYTGFSIELWDMIADKAGFEYELYGVNTLAKLLDEVERGAADVAAAGIGITEQRETTLDFSYAYLDSGLQIMVPTNDRGLWGDSLISLVRAIFSRQLLEVLALLFFFLLVAAHIMWASERHVNQDFAESYWPGIWDAFWWSAVTATTVGYGDHVPRTIIGRIVGIFWMFSGLFVLASFTASIATAFAVDGISTQINGPQDLYGKQVATIERSAAADYLVRQGIRPVLYLHEDDAYQALVEGNVDAMVYDAPVLQYYVAQDQDEAVELIDEIFQTQHYGIAIAKNPELREEINLALLQLIESGDYGALQQKWFGEE